MQIDDATVFITGANRGLGLGFARDALARGARKVCAGMRDRLKLSLAGVEALRLDVRRAEDVAAAAGRCTDVMLLINDAGIATFGGLLSADSVESARAQLETSLTRDIDRPKSNPGAGRAAYSRCPGGSGRSGAGRRAGAPDQAGSGARTGGVLARPRRRRSNCVPLRPA